MIKGSEAKAYKLRKALYSLRQAPRAWNKKLNTVLQELKFEKCLQEPSIYRKEKHGHLLIVAVYVDDLLVTSSSLDMIREFKSGMATRFEMSGLGKKVIQRKESIVLIQERYAAKILEESGMKSCNAVHIPMDAWLRLSKVEEERSVDERDYRRSIGFLCYLINTQPDLAYSVVFLSRYMHDPKESHKTALKQVLRYLQGTLSHGLVFVTKS